MNSSLRKDSCEAVMNCISYVQYFFGGGLGVLGGCSIRTAFGFLHFALRDV